jgi:hypothetical protein
MLRSRPHRPVRRVAVLGALLLAAAGCSTAVQPPVLAASCPQPAAIVGDAAHPFAAVRYLADDALEGRRAGSDAERCAGDYLAAEFARIGLEPYGDQGGFFHDVPVHSAMNPHEPGGIGRNVIGILRGSDPVLREEAVVIGAHYDHLGLGGMGSLAPDEHGAIHNGADDNASGVAAMITAAKRLIADPPARSVIFIAFSGEELGLLGSARWVAEAPIPMDRIRAMLNLDMVGRLEEDPLIVYGVGTAAEWPEILERANSDGIPLAPRPDGYGPSDHTSFYARDIPVLHFFTNTHADYHRPSDEWHLVDVEGVDRIAALVARVAADVGGRTGALALVRGVGQAPQAGGATRGLGAYLGTIPDYAPAERGMRVGGVRAGSPAEEAGLQAGDVILAIGEHATDDIYAFTDALRAHSAGERVRLLVLREGSEIALHATLGERP